tara:strand:- start:586 stop:1131 length:546 start_codon:yes stop_codon:yes gene_type:complete
MSDNEDVFEKQEHSIKETEIEPNTQEEEKKEQKPVKKARKPLSDEQKERLRQQLKKGRETSLLKRQNAAKEKKENTVILTKTKKKEIHAEIDTEEKEKERLNKDIEDLRNKLKYLLDRDELTKKEKEQVKEIKKEIKTEIKKEEPIKQLRPKTPPPLEPVYEEPEQPKQLMWSALRGNYYI